MDAMNAPPRAVPDDAAWLLDLIAGSGGVTFQTFDDSKSGRKGLTRVLHGSLAQHSAALSDLNDRGAGVYFMVNGGDGKGRKATNVRTVRALFVDLDGSPLQPVLDGPIKPHATVESSPGRFHAYWLVTGVSLEQFGKLQSAIASMFGGDPKVKDLPRVMRLPGFLHRKGEPFTCKVLSLERRPRYSAQTVERAFPVVFEAPARANTKLPEVIPEGGRNQALFDLARGLVSRGYDLAGVNKRLQRINAERCQPPLCATEVDAIVLSAISHGSHGFAAIPHAVIDSPEWRGLPHAARSIVVAAYRRFNGTNDGEISLPFSDFEVEFSRKHFYDMRGRAVRAGFLRVARKGSYSQRGGKVADLFGIGVHRTPNRVSK